MGKRFSYELSIETQAHGQPSNYKTHTNLVIFSQNASKAGITSRFLNALVTKTMFSAKTCLNVLASNLRLSKVGVVDNFFKTSYMPLRRGSSGRIPSFCSS